MPRYIDADKFTERIKVSPAFRNINDGLLLQRVVIDLLNNIPTAEDVPKSEVDILKSLITYKEEEAYNKGYEDGKADMQSEVEKLQNELVIWKQNRFNLFQRLECYEMARQKVASEIFEEIQKSIVHNILHNESYSFEGVIDCITKDLDELKKKYTEGEPIPASEEKYFSPEDVRKMTNQEVRENYTAIRKSMERW